VNLEGVVFVAAGNVHSMLIKNNSKAFSFGAGDVFFFLLN
jgi:hypothetical protein